MKRFCFTFILVFTILLFSTAALAAVDQSIKFNINGIDIPQEALGTTKIINQTTFVPLRAINEQFSNLKTDWDNTNKIVIVTNKNNNEVLKLPVGSNVAYKGDTQISLSSPARNINGVVYVPLRFIGEDFDHYVFWDAETRCIVIYEENAEAAKAINSNDLAEARNAVLKLPKISLQELYSSGKEGLWSNTYYFLYGVTKRFIVTDRDLLFYYVVKNNAAWLIWQSKEDENNKNEKDAIPNIVNNLSKEWGKRPDLGNKVSYFFDYHMAGIVRYGTIENGVRAEIEEIVKDDLNDKTVAYKIPDEVKTD